MLARVLSKGFEADESKAEAKMKLREKEEGQGCGNALLVSDF